MGRVLFCPSRAGRTQISKSRGGKLLRETRLRATGNRGSAVAWETGRMASALTTSGQISDGMKLPGVQSVSTQLSESERVDTRDIKTFSSTLLGDPKFLQDQQKKR